MIISESEEKKRKLRIKKKLKSYYRRLFISKCGVTWLRD